MYNKYINNLGFFKGISNSNFILKVVMNFGEVVALKNEILLKEDGIIEEMYFVKEGRLGLEISINENAKLESIEKYLCNDFLSFTENEIKNTNAEINSPKPSKPSDIKSPFREYSKRYTMSPRKKRRNTNQENEDENISYIKILDMHKNEDFGSIFMFMNKRCPFTVRVKSRKAEMFILKKNDVLQLAEEYQNIWRRLNKKALKNMKGIKNMVTKAINKYCELKGVLIKNSTTNLKAKKHHFGSMIDTNNFNQSDLVDENIRKTIRNNSGKFHTVVTIGKVKTIKVETTNIFDKNYNFSSEKIQ